jgi:hypothetical protein
VSPYRQVGRDHAEGAASGPVEPDDLPFLLGLTLVLGVVRLAIAVATGERWGAEASLAAGLVVAAALGLLRLHAERRVARRRRWRRRGSRGSG